jgi:glyoxylase-like metal-dependent hydrolase (beta-lactamase superfamily II)
MANIRLGQMEIRRVEDFIDPKVPVEFLLPDISEETIAENLDWLTPRFYDPSDRTVAIHVQSWLFRTPSFTVLVDTCVGNQKTRHFPPFHMRNNLYLERLREAGASPEGIDYVFCTHLHSDHVGWNTRLENGHWVPTFPNAKYLFSRADYDALDPRRNSIEGIAGGDEDTFMDSVLPVVEAGLAEFVEGQHEIGDGLTVVPAPGHSPGHCVLRLEAFSDSGLFTGI